MIAKQVGRGPLQSLCLNRNSRFAYTYTNSETYCDGYASGEYGPIDGDGKHAY